MGIVGDFGPDLTDEEYAGIKERYPNISFDDETRTFISKKGNVTSAKMLKKFKPMTPEIRAMGPAAAHAAKQNNYQKYLRHVAAGKRITEACRLADLSYDAVKSRRLRDPEFAELEKQAEAQAAEPIETSLYQAALSGNVPAAIKWLEKRSTQRWPSDKIQIESNTNIELDVTDNLKNIAALVERLQQRRQYLEAVDVEAEEPKELPPG